MSTNQKQLQPNNTNVDGSAYDYWTVSLGWRQGVYHGRALTVHDAIERINAQIFVVSRKPPTRFTRGYIYRLDELRHHMIQGRRQRSKSNVR